MSANLQTLMLADTGRRTTRLGYGCGSLMGALGRRESSALLEAAFDAGIRHFDVAPMYGYGAAEACLGEFLARHASEATVTTKYGIPAVKNASLMGLARRVVGPIVQRIPGLKQKLARAAAAVAAPAEKASFTAAQAQVSLENSLTALRISRIDVWLLHEVEAADLQNDGLLRFLEDAVANGKIGTFGVGSDGWKVEALTQARPEYCRVVQREWSVRDAVLPEGGGFRILHRAMTENSRALHAALTADAALCARWSTEIGAELARSEVLANLMLKAALVMNPGSLILAASKNAKHIAANVAVVGDEALEAPARRLYAVVQREGVPGMEEVAA